MNNARAARSLLQAGADKDAQDGRVRPGRGPPKTGVLAGEQRETRGGGPAARRGVRQGRPTGVASAHPPLAVSSRAGADATVSGRPGRRAGGRAAAAGAGRGPRAAGSGRTRARRRRSPAQPLGPAEAAGRGGARGDAPQSPAGPRRGRLRACAGRFGKRAAERGRGRAARPDAVGGSSPAWGRGRAANPDLVRRLGRARGRGLLSEPEPSERSRRRPAPPRPKVPRRHARAEAHPRNGARGIRGGRRERGCGLS